MNADLPFAEDLPYWQTGKSAFDSWLEKAERFLVDSGGVVVTGVLPNGATAQEVGAARVLRSMPQLLSAEVSS